MLYSNIVLKTKNERVFDRMEKYREQLDDLKKEIKELEGRSTTYSGVRFVSFIVAVAGLIIGIYDSRSVFIAIGIVLAVAFIAMVFVHGKLSEKLEYKKAEAEVLRRYVARFGDDWKKFCENGSEYLGKDDLSAKDMDLLGQNSPEQRKDDAALQRVSKILDMILR